MKVLPGRVIDAHTVQVLVDPETNTVHIRVSGLKSPTEIEVLRIEKPVQINLNGVWKFFK